MAAKNDGGQEVLVYDIRKLWSPYDQSCILGGSSSKKVDADFLPNISFGGSAQKYDWE